MADAARGAAPDRLAIGPRPCRYCAHDQPPVRGEPSGGVRVPRAAISNARESALCERAEARNVRSRRHRDQHGSGDRWKCGNRGAVRCSSGPERVRLSRARRVPGRRSHVHDPAHLLRRFPLRARKRRDFEIWSRAVERWAAHAYDLRPDGRFHAEMRRDADRLRAVRRYVKAPPPALDGPAEQLLAYFGGFFSGEGCFGLSGLVNDRPAIPRVRRASTRQDMRRGTRIFRFSVPSRPKASRTSSPRRRTRAFARPTPTGRLATRSRRRSVAGRGRSRRRALDRA